MSEDIRYRGTTYHIYTRREADTLGIAVKEDWRHGKAGDHVLTDTGYVVPVLKSGIWGRTPWIRTPCGTFPARKIDTLTHRKREDFYRLGGRPPEVGLSRRVREFAKLYARTGKIEESYRIAFPDAKSRSYILERGKFLIDLPAVQNIIQDERKVILRELGIDIEAILKDQKEILELLKDKEDVPALNLRHRINLHFERLLSEMSPVGRITESTEIELGEGEARQLSDGERRRVKIEKSMTMRLSQDVEGGGGAKPDDDEGRTAGQSSA